MFVTQRCNFSKKYDLKSCTKHQYLVGNQDMTKSAHCLVKNESGMDTQIGPSNDYLIYITTKSSIKTAQKALKKFCR